jgi:threonine dehydrogenase-like Zn-dependent dehydrogenase
MGILIQFVGAVKPSDRKIQRELDHRKEHVRFQLKSKRRLIALSFRGAFKHNGSVTPIVLGHEFCGVVEEVGANVTASKAAGLGSVEESRKDGI